MLLVWQWLSLRYRDYRLYYFDMIGLCDIVSYQRLLKIRIGLFELIRTHESIACLLKDGNQINQGFLKLKVSNFLELLLFVVRL